MTPDGNTSPGGPSGESRRDRPPPPARPDRNDHGGKGRDGGKRDRRPTHIHVAPSEGSVHQIAQIQFKGVRSEFFLYHGDVGLRKNEHVVVEADRGQDLGWVMRTSDADAPCDGGCEHAGHHPVIPPEKRVIRRAAPADMDRRILLTENEPEVRMKTRDLVLRHRLKMKVSEAEWQWDRNKLTVYFTAEKRVDFRALVKEMARTFKTRIELRQIGVRDEAKRLGGIGRCGRELCCRLWLPEIEPVTLQLAKDQGLSLNPAQISGACGRLMSCLRYEHEAYLQARKRFPKVGTKLRTVNGEEEVTEWDMFRDTVTLRQPDASVRTVPLGVLKSETLKSRLKRKTTP
jgi:cell fate regulator YaaT (PSP1 superfamily)